MYSVRRLERSWWQFLWELRRQCMPVEVTGGAMEAIPVTLVGMPLKDMPPQGMLEADTLVSVLAVAVVTIGRAPRAAMPALQGAHVIGMVAVTGAVTGEA